MFKTINLFLEATHDCEKQSLGLSQRSSSFLFRFSGPWTVHVSALISHVTVLTAPAKYNHMEKKKWNGTRTSFSLLESQWSKCLVFLYLQIILEVRNSSNTTENDIVSTALW